APYTISVIVGDFDGDNDESAPVAAQVIVHNAAPANVSLNLSATAINENGSATLDGSLTDPGTLDGHTGVFNWGDGSANSTSNLAAGVLTFSGIPHQYLDNPAGQPHGSFPVSVTVTDKDGDSGTASTAVEVDNVAPANVSLNLSAGTINENDSVT